MWKKGKEVMGKERKEEMVSLVIPVYNAREYLKQCVDKILEQTYQDLEVILVDNGSTDDSLAICREYEKNYDNIHVCVETEKGVAHARNTGMKQACGAYLMFVDADDYLKSKQTLACLVKKAKESQADIVIGNYVRLWEGRVLPAARNLSLQTLDRDSMEFRFRGFFSQGILSYAWGRVYRREFLENAGITFLPYTYAEDKAFNFCCYLSGASYAFVNENVYVYRKNEDSVSFSYRKDSKECWMKIAEDTKKWDKENHCMDLVGNTICFAAFFDAKMEYEHENGGRQAARQCLAAYGEDAFAREYFELFIKGKMPGVSSAMWKMMLWGFSVAMTMRLYGLLSFGISLLVNCGIDEILSDTGKRKKNEKK